MFLLSHLIRACPEEHPVLLTETNLIESDRKKTMELFFENFNTPYSYFANQDFLSLFSSGHLTGLSIDSYHCFPLVICGLSIGMGESGSRVVPVYEGHPIYPNALSNSIGGDAVTDYLIKLLAKKDEYKLNPLYIDTVRDIKERTSEVSIDPDTLFKEKHLIAKYYDPRSGRGQEMMGSEVFECNEVIFNPGLVQEEKNKEQGIHQLVLQAILNSSSEIRKELLSRIMLAGGVSMTQGLPQRLTNEIENILPQSIIKEEYNSIQWISKEKSNLL